MNHNWTEYLCINLKYFNNFISHACVYISIYGLEKKNKNNKDNNKER